MLPVYSLLLATTVLPISVDFTNSNRGVFSTGIIAKDLLAATKASGMDCSNASSVIMIGLI
jgi:hypothetical protein